MKLTRISGAIALAFTIGSVPAFAFRAEHPTSVNRNNSYNIDQRFNQLDRNRDGYIRFSEWNSDRTSFDRLDLDRNGVITRSEMEQAFANRGNGARRNNGRNNRFRQMDRDGNGVITPDEWTGDQQTFRNLDLNGDGRLTMDELRQARGRNRY